MRPSDFSLVLTPWTWRGRAALDRYRDRSLLRIVRHAYQHVPHYRSAFDQAGIQPHDIRSKADLEHLPTLGKRQLRAAGDNLLAQPPTPTHREATPLITRRTSGSTGQPISIRRTWAEERLLGLVRWRALAGWGWRPHHRHVEVEEPIEVDPNDRRAMHRVANYFGLFRQERLDALRASEEILRNIERARPDVLTGYGGVIARVARSASFRAPGNPAATPRFVAVHSDTFTKAMRSAVEQAFGCPVFEIYDANETNVIATQCVASDDLHVVDDSVIVEVLVDGRPAAPGETGEVVITALHSYAMPLVRYRIGDTAEQGARQCFCGSSFSTLRAVRGRMFDDFPLADGRTLHPYELINCINQHAPWIEEFRFLQERTDLIHLRFISSPPPSPDQTQQLQRAASALLGHGADLVCQRVEQLTLEETARARICRSLVASEYDAAHE